LAKLTNEQQARDEGYHFAEAYFRESEAHNDDSLYNLASLYALRGRKGSGRHSSAATPPLPPQTTKH
jgi:hypothetical protein